MRDAGPSPARAELFAPHPGGFGPGASIRPETAETTPAPLHHPEPTAHTMGHHDAKDHALSLLREVLVWIGQHDVSPDPITYAVFYEHLSGRNDRLSAALEPLLAAHARLTDAQLRALHATHIAAPGGDDAERIRGDMQRVMDRIADSAARTGQAAGAFGAGLDGLQNALQAEDAAALAVQVAQARQKTQVMQASVDALQEQVSSSHAEIERLRSDLERMREQAVRCALTGVLNRRGFDDQLQKMLATLPADGAEHCVVLIDIDHFKRVNDTYGHPVGDKVIAGLGEVLRMLPPEPGMSLARYGGEEFAILLPSSSRRRAVRVAEWVRSRVGRIGLRSKQTQEVRLNITVSAGVAAWKPGDEAQALLVAADGALYRAKAAGRDRVVVD
jgi:diguanylate cyclase